CTMGCCDLAAKAQCAGDASCPIGPSRYCCTSTDCAGGTCNAGVGGAAGTCAGAGAPLAPYCPNGLNTAPVVCSRGMGGSAQCAPGDACCGPSPGVCTAGGT